LITDAPEEEASILEQVLTGSLIEEKKGARK
jgi:hypothetical protein